MMLLRLLWAVLLTHLRGIDALVTMQTIRDITNTTDNCRSQIVGQGSDSIESSAASMWLGGEMQNVLKDGEDDGNRDELEDTVAAALRILCLDLLIELEKPVEKQLALEPSAQNLPCRVILREYRAFLGATVRFLHAEQEMQMRWNWGMASPVFDALVWLQGLWASRKGNSQDRSFIEQQMMFYGGSGCFKKGDQEVLRRGVEVVEYMNDLIDTFD